MDSKAMYKLSYGLFVLTAKLGDKVNGCITNTAIQVASEPNQISFAVNKANYTHEMLMKSDVCYCAEQKRLGKDKMRIAGCRQETT